MNWTAAPTERGKVTLADTAGLRAFEPWRSDRPIVRIHLLGPMRATTCFGDNILPHGKKARAVLGYLCLAAGESVPRARLATLLWDRLHEATARTKLCQALHELSTAFGAFAKELIAIDQDTIRLNVGACWIDALAALTLDPLALDSPRGDLQALCGGELLEDVDGAGASFDRWLLDERTRVTKRLPLLLQCELEHARQKNCASPGLTPARADTCERPKSPRNYTQCTEALRETSNPQGSPEPRIDPLDSHLPAPVKVRMRHPKQRPESGRNRLRVGVLPFLATNLEKEENLASFFNQETVAALARFRWFDVIAAISPSHAPSARFVDEHQLRHMNLDYLVDGAISGIGTGVQINVRLMDLAEYARPIWVECFNLARGEMHRVNELISSSIVGRIDPAILFIEGQPKRRDRYGATQLLLLAIPLMVSMERKQYERAGLLISRALEIDPDNSMAATWAAHWHLFRVGQGWARDVAQALKTVQTYAVRALKLDPTNAAALGLYAHYCSFADKDFDAALYHFERALRLNPSLASIWALSGTTYCYIGEPEIALERLERYRDLTPIDPYFSWFETLYTIAYTIKGDYERAVIVGRRAVKAVPDFVNGYKPLIASLGHLGRRDEAKPYIAKLLSLEPNFTVERFGQVYPLKKASDRRRYMRGLRLAGVPER
jgi:tetratricopeptide (TPR) repeat protein